MPSDAAGNFSSFFSRFRAEGKRLAREAQQRLTVFFHALREKEKSLAEVVHLEAPHYNIFEVLPIRSMTDIGREVVVMSTRGTELFRFGAD